MHEACPFHARMHSTSAAGFARTTLGNTFRTEVSAWETFGWDMKELGAHPATSLRGASAFSVRCENHGGRAFLSRCSFALASASAASSLLPPSAVGAPFPSPSINPAACNGHGTLKKTCQNWRSMVAGRSMPTALGPAWALQTASIECRDHSFSRKDV